MTSKQIDALAESDQASLTELKQKCEEYLSGWQRAKADYENLKKDNAKKMAEIMELATASLILNILPIYDQYQLALDHIPKGQSETEWLQGFRHIKRSFEHLLKQLNIVAIESVGEPFNPKYHEAVGYEDSHQPDEVIIKEVQAGYLFDNKVIRPAKVIVAKPGQAVAADQEDNNNHKEDQSPPGD